MPPSGPGAANVSAIVGVPSDPGDGDAGHLDFLKPNVGGRRIGVRLVCVPRMGVNPQLGVAIASAKVSMRHIPSRRIGPWSE